MCTVVVSIEPGSRVPLLLAGVRDEFAVRPWSLPARHWPRWPALVGGLDLQAGGTWLAVDPERSRVACVLNGFGRSAPEETRLSRGELPLLAAAEDGLPDLEFGRYDPFHLVLAEHDAAILWNWNGIELTRQTLDPGLHIIVNTGLEGRQKSEVPHPQAAADIQARLAHFRPLLVAATRPEPVEGDPHTAWGAWLPIIDGAGLDRDDTRALVVRRDFGNRGTWGTSSISLVGLRPGGVRYDFCAAPGTGEWSQVAVRTGARKDPA